MNQSIICKHIEKQYGSKTILQDVNLTIEPNKIYGLIGRNGVGKTTLLSILSAQNTASGGEVLLGAEKVWENKNALEHICFSRELNVNASTGIGSIKIKDYIRMASILYPKWDKEMAKRLLEEFELNGKQRLNKLSKGMLSMVTILIALASKAEYTFLDEPVAGLDVIMREYFYKILLEEYSETGRTFLISTHIIEEAADVFEEVIMMKDGGLLLKENTQELIERAVMISGRSEEVDTATGHLKKYHEEQNGRGKSVVVLLEKGESIDTTGQVQVRSLNLQNIFAALCGKGA